MIDGDQALPLARQAQQLDISRGSIYDLPRPVSPADPLIMRRIDEHHLFYPSPAARCCAISSGRKAWSSADGMSRR